MKEIKIDISYDFEIYLLLVLIDRASEVYDAQKFNNLITLFSYVLSHTQFAMLDMIAWIAWVENTTQQLINMPIARMSSVRIWSEEERQRFQMHALRFFEKLYAVTWISSTIIETIIFSATWLKKNGTISLEIVYLITFLFLKKTGFSQDAIAQYQHTFSRYVQLPI
jgi:Protein of unknown function (DUF494)